jgi:hypothetical protein
MRRAEPPVGRCHPPARTSATTQVALSGAPAAALEEKGMRSGGVGLNAHGLLLASFTLGATSHRQGVWRALDWITYAAEHIGIRTEPVTFELMRTEVLDQRCKVDELHRVNCTCDPMLPFLRRPDMAATKSFDLSQRIPGR